MDEFGNPGWKVWSRDPTPAQVQNVQANEPVEQGPVLNLEQGPVLKPCTRDLEEERQKVLDSLLRLKNAKMIEDVSEEKPVKLEKQESIATCATSQGLVITLKWDHMAQALALLLLLQMVYQFHQMSSRILVLEATMRR